MTTDEELDLGVCALAPVTDRALEEVHLDAIAGQIRIRITSERPDVDVVDLDTARTRQRNKRSVTALAAAATLALGATAAAAGLLQARTGEFGGGEGFEEGAGEMIRLDAPDAGPIVDSLGSNIPLPPGNNFEGWKAFWLGSGPDPANSGGEIMTTSGIRSELERDAACQWTLYWLEADQGDDGPALARSQQILDRVPTWDGIVASDGGGIVHSYTELAASAKARDRNGVRARYESNCPIQTAD